MFGNSVTLKISSLTMDVSDHGYDKTWYQQRSTIEEVNSVLYDTLRNEKYNLLVDVGANYGLVSLSAYKKNPDLRVLAVEPDQRLIPYIKKNFEVNGLDESSYKLINSIAASKSLPSQSFSINPNSTLDNRVDMEEWEKQQVPSVSLDDLLMDTLSSSDKVFIKIDTQGYELEVLKGSEQFLSSNINWAIKAEFAPSWMESQGYSPAAFLEYVIERYDVFECPERFEYKTRTLRPNERMRLLSKDIPGYIEHVRNLNSKDRGWVDILIFPKKKWWQFK